MKTTALTPRAWRKAAVYKTAASLALIPVLLMQVNRASAQKAVGTANAAAPGAGGYSSDFGTDFGVGRQTKVAGREPVVAIGFKGKTPNGSIPWLGLRFAELLSERLQPVMGHTTPSAGLSRFLASRGLRPQDMGCPAKESDTLGLPALVQLRNENEWRKRSDIVVLGDVTVKGVSSQAAPTAQADALMRDGSSVTIRVRALRNRPQSLVIASNIVTVTAPGREWAQLPARVALALLDDMRVTITEDERSDFLRDASPLLSSASQIRVRTESRLGAAVSLALDAQVFNVKAREAKSAPAKSALWRQALTTGETAQRQLRELIKRPAASTIRDGDIFASMNVSARNWLAYAEAASGTARRSLKGR